MMCKTTKCNAFWFTLNETVGKAPNNEAMHWGVTALNTSIVRPFNLRYL